MMEWHLNKDTSFEHQGYFRQDSLSFGFKPEILPDNERCMDHRELMAMNTGDGRGSHYTR